MAMATMERLVGGFYQQAARLAAATGGGAGPDAALALYLAKADPLMVLRDLLGHSSRLVTRRIWRRLDMTRIYAEAYQQATFEVAGEKRSGRKPPTARHAATFETGTGDADDGEPGLWLVMPVRR